MRVCRELIQLNLEDGIISWPRGQQAIDVIAAFERAYGFPGMLFIHFFKILNEI
jgi:hypothetical protein